MTKVTKVLAIDLGNFNICSSEGIIFKCTFIEGSPINPLGEEILRIGDKIYCMDKETSFEYESNKAEKNYLPNLLYAIHRSTSHNNIKLVLGVPIDNIGIAENFKKVLEGKEFEFEVNGTKRKIFIEALGIVAEGVSSYYMIPTNKRNNEDIMIIDIGGRTTNVVTFRNNRIELKRTISLGMINYYDQVKEKYNYNGNNINTEQIFSFINKGLIEEDPEHKKNFVKGIINELDFIVKNKDFYQIFVTGGGSISLKEELIDLIPKSNFMNDPLFSNVKGNEKIGLSKWII